MEQTKTAGFTLVETLMVMVVIGVLAAVVAPSFLTWMPNMRLKDSARDIYSAIQHAKLEAVKQSSCTGVAFATVAFPATGGGFTSFVDNGAGGGVACNGLQDGTETQFSTGIVADDVSLITATNMGGPSTVCFTPTSVICGSQSGNILVRNGTRWFRATIAASGGIRIEKSTDLVNWSD